MDICKPLACENEPLARPVRTAIYFDSILANCVAGNILSVHWGKERQSHEYQDLLIELEKNAFYKKIVNCTCLPLKINLVKVEQVSIIVYAQSVFLDFRR